MITEHLNPDRLLTLQPPKQKIDGVAKILSTQEKNSSPATFMMDLDYTAIEGEKLKWSDGKSRRVKPETVAAFMALRESGVRLGIVTEQGFGQMEPTLNDIAALASDHRLTAYEFFEGPVIGEGIVVRHGTGKKRGQFTILSTPQAERDRQMLLQWLKENIIPAKDDEWEGGVLTGTDPNQSTLVKLPPPPFEKIGTISVFEKGPHVMDNSEYAGRYQIIQKRIDQAINDLGISTLQTYEGGNGDCRIAPKGSDKATTLMRIAGIGAIDPSRMVMVGDGYPDYRIGLWLRTKGGAMLAVENAIPELHNIADYSAKGKVGLGIADFVSRIFPKKYSSALNNLRERGLYLTQ